MSVRFHKTTDQSKGAAGTWSYDFCHNGVRYRKMGFDTRKDASYAEALERERVVVGKKAPTPPRRITFDALCDAFFDSRGLYRAPRTVAAEIQKAKALKRFFSGMAVPMIDVPHIERYRDTRVQRGLAARTINLELILMRCMLKFAINHGYASSNPAAMVSNLVVPKTRKRIPSDDELCRLLDEARRTPSGQSLVVWIWLMIYTGLRPSEAAHLEWRDIDLQRSQLHVLPKEGNPLKNARARAVEIHPALQPILGRWKVEWDKTFEGLGRAGEHEWVFYNPRKPGQRCETFQKSFQMACRAAKIEGITRYSLRHYFISNAYMSDIDSLTIARWAGHANTRMIDEVYGHLTPQHRRQQMNKLKLDVREQGLDSAQTA